MKDRVAAVQVQRNWAVPGLLSDELAALDVGASILGGLASSRLDKILVRDEKLAVSVSAGHAAVPPHRPVRSHGDGEAGSRPGGGREAARRDPRRVHRQRPDRGRSAARGDQRGRRRESAASRRSAASAARPPPWPRARSMRATATFYQKHARDLCGSDRPAEVTSAMQQLADPPGARRSGSSRASARRTKKPRPRQEGADRRHRRSPRQARPAAGRASRAARFPRRHRTSLCRTACSVDYAQRTARPGDPARAVVRRRLLRRRAGRARAAEHDPRLLDEGAAASTAQQIAEEQERLGAAYQRRRQRRPQQRHVVGAQRQPRRRRSTCCRHRRSGRRSRPARSSGSAPSC